MPHVKAGRCVALFDASLTYLVFETSRSSRTFGNQYSCLAA